MSDPSAQNLEALKKLDECTHRRHASALMHLALTSREHEVQGDAIYILKSAPPDVVAPHCDFFVEQALLGETDWHQSASFIVLWCAMPIELAAARLEELLPSLENERLFPCILGITSKVASSSAAWASVPSPAKERIKGWIDRFCKSGACQGYARDQALSLRSQLRSA